MPTEMTYVEFGIPLCALIQNMALFSSLRSKSGKCWSHLVLYVRVVVEL